MSHTGNPETGPQIANGEGLLIGKRPFLRSADITGGRKNKLCKRCQMPCKQSALAKVVRCPQFMAKKESE